MKKLLVGIFVCVVRAIVECSLRVCVFVEWLFASRVIVESKIDSEKPNIRTMKPDHGPGWGCPACGYMNHGANEICMGAEMGDGRCGKAKPPPSNPIFSVRSMPSACIEEPRRCDECGLEQTEREDRGCH